MFVPLTDKRHLDVPPEHVVTVIESINRPNIAIPSVGTEPARCYIVGTRTHSGQFALWVYMLLEHSWTPVLFGSTTPEVSLDDYSAHEASAIEFVESMGFMLDNLSFGALPIDERIQRAGSLPFFFPSPPRPAPADDFGDALPSVQGHMLEEAMLIEDAVLVDDTSELPPAVIGDLASSTQALSTDEVDALARLLAAL